MHRLDYRSIFFSNQNLICLFKGLKCASCADLWRSTDTDNHSLRENTSHLSLQPIELPKIYPFKSPNLGFHISYSPGAAGATGTQAPSSGGQRNFQNKHVCFASVARICVTTALHCFGWVGEHKILVAALIS